MQRNPVVLLRHLPLAGILYSVLKISAPIWMVGLVVLPFFTGSFQGDILDWRAFASSATSHHTLILWGYSVLFFALWLKQKIDPVVAVVAVFMVISVHELFWWSFDFIWMGQVAGYVTHWYWLFGYLLPPTLGCFLIYPQFLPFPRRLILAAFFFDFVWVVAGWPVTVNYVPASGITTWYGTDWGNGWETASWYTLIGAFWVFERKNLTKAQLYMTTALKGGQ